MIGEGQAAGSGNHRMHRNVAELFICFLQKGGKCLPDIGKMSFVVGEQNGMLFIENCNFDCSGADINTKCICHIKSFLFSLISVQMLYRTA